MSRMSRFDVTKYGRFFGGNRRGRKGVPPSKQARDGQPMPTGTRILMLEPLEPKVLLTGDVWTDLGRAKQ